VQVMRGDCQPKCRRAPAVADRRCIRSYIGYISPSLRRRYSAKARGHACGPARPYSIEYFHAWARLNMSISFSKSVPETRSWRASHYQVRALPGNGSSVRCRTQLPARNPTLNRNKAHTWQFLSDRACHDTPHRAISLSFERGPKHWPGCPAKIMVRCLRQQRRQRLSRDLRPRLWRHRAQLFALGSAEYGESIGYRNAPARVACGHVSERSNKPHESLNSWRRHPFAAALEFAICAGSDGVSRIKPGDSKTRPLARRLRYQARDAPTSRLCVAQRQDVVSNA
jgi:hypothetical protein